MRIVYLHGFASGPGSGKAQWFRERFREKGIELEIPDLVPGAFEELTITGQLEVLDQTLRGEPAHLAGSSMGGYLAALYASKHEEIQKLVLLAPAFQFPQRWPEELGEEKAAEWRRSGSMEVFHYGEGRPRNIGWGLVEDALKYDPEPTFRQPALIFHGTNDTVVPAAYSESYAKRHPNAELFLLNSDHQLTDSTQFIWDRMEPFFGI